MAPNIQNLNSPTNWYAEYKAPDLIGRGRIYRRDLARTDTIYRYMELDRLLMMLDEKVLSLASPRKWHDPYEDWWCDQVFAPGSKLASARAFGSCWTTNYIDEPFWRLYACKCDDKGGSFPAVRIATTIDKLIHVLSWANDIDFAKAFIGKVRYPKRSSHLMYLAKRLHEGLDQHVARIAANALFTKRAAYQFENEVRILWIDRQGDRDFHHVKIEPLSLIKYITIGPTKSEDDIAHIVEKLLDRGIPADRIRKSRLYRTPPRLLPVSQHF